MKNFTLFVVVLLSTTLSAQCFQEVSAGSSYYLAISQDGSLWGWGLNLSGQLGDGTTTTKTTPVMISNNTWSWVTAGDNHSLGIKSDGTLWAWGSDASGQLGNGSNGSALYPSQIGTATNWKEVHAGYQGTIAIKTDGTLWGWGSNNGYFLGNGEELNFISQVPVQIGTASDWNTIAARGWSCLAIKSNGALWGWGDNSFGQLGDGTNTNIMTPIQIGTSAWLQISNNARLSVGIKSDGSLWAWGSHSASGSSLGIGQIYTPLQIGFANNWKQVSIKAVTDTDYVLLLKTDNTLWAWGSDWDEQLGNGTVNNDYPSPTQVGSDTDWNDVTAGHRQSYAAKTDGTFWAWGATTLIGNGTGSTAVPTQYSCTALPVADFFSGKVFLYPNPVQSFLSFEYDGVVISINVFDLNGRKFEMKHDENPIDVSMLSNGIYILELETSEGMLTRKFVKQ